MGLVFAAYIQSTARQPEAARITQPFLWIGFAVVAGVVALFGAQATAVLRGGTLVPGLGAREAPTRRPVGATRSP